MHWGPVTRTAAIRVGNMMRDSDQRECWGGLAWHPHMAVEKSLRRSTVQRAIFSENDKAIGICGVTPAGIIWLLATHELLATAGRRAQFHRGARQWVDGLVSSQLFPVLEAWTLWSPDRARWLEALGFTVEEPELMGFSHQLFAHVHRRSRW